MLVGRYIGTLIYLFHITRAGSGQAFTIHLEEKPRKQLHLDVIKIHKEHTRYLDIHRFDIGI